MRTWIIIPDLHYPFHDPKYIKVVTRAITAVKPNGGIVQLGDAVDWFQLSRFDKDPSRKNTARDDLELYREQMIKWAALLPAGAEFRQLEGNHEARLTKYVWGRAGDLSQMVYIIPDMLGIKELNKITSTKFGWFPFTNYRACIIGDCILHHGHFFNEHVAANNLKRYMHKYICGHTHRLQVVYFGDLFSATLGHGSLEHQTSHIPAPTGWAQAFGVLTEIDGICNLEIIPVTRGSCVLRGKRVSA